MKKTFRLLLAIAAAAICAIGCQPSELEQAASKTVHFHAVDVTSKTTFGTPSGNTLPTLWQEGDEVYLYVNSVYNERIKAAVTPSADGTTANFTADLSSTSKDITIAAISPASASTGASTAHDSYTVTIPINQTPTAASVDPAAQIICASAAGYTTMPSEVNLTFHHVTAYAKMSITNLNCGSETVTSVSVTSSTPIVGKWFYYPEATDEQDARTLADAPEASNTVIINTSSLNDIWFALAPVSVDGENFKIVVTTTGGKYAKTINFSGKSFQAGHVAKFTVNMAGISKEADDVYTLVTDASALVPGAKVIIAAAESAYAIGTQNGNNRAAAAVTKTGNTIVSPSAAVTVFSIENGTKTGTIAFKASDGYLYAASSGSNYLKTQATLNDNGSWSVTVQDGVATMLAQGTNSRNKLLFNASNNPVLFSCYAPTSTTQKPVAIYISGDAIKKVQTLSFSESAIEVDLADTFTKPVLSGAKTEVSYKSSNTAVATVNATTGDVTLVGAGTTTITATAAEDDTYYGATASYTITVTDLNPKAISAVAKDVACTVQGKVAAICTNGFIVADATGAVFVYKKADGLSVGQTVTVTGTPAVYNTSLQFPATSTVKTGTAGSYSYPSATTLDSSAAATFVARTGEHLAQYVTFSGEVSGTRDFILSGDTEAKVTGYYMTDELAALVAGALEVTVKGYATSVSSEKVQVVVTEVVQNMVAPKLPDTLSFPQKSWSGTTNYPLQGFTVESIQNYTYDWTITATPDGTVFTYARWSSRLYYSLSTNYGAARTGWIKLTLTNGKYSVSKTYEFVQAANPDAQVTSRTFDFTAIPDWGEWTSSYGEHTVKYDVADVVFASANKQSSTITDQPVTKGSPVEIKMTNGATMKSVSFQCTQWTTKAQTITLNYSTDGGTTYTSTGVTSTNFAISSETLPAGTNAVKISFNSTSNQVGIASATITY